MSWSPRSRTDAWDRLSRAEPPEWVLDHVACVEALAVAMAERANAAGHDVDMDLVRFGAILHDLGRSVTQDPTHAFVGAELLRAEDADPRLVRIVERHTGAGLTAADAEGLGLPARDLLPETLEEKIVAHADNLWSGDKRVGLDHVREKYASKGLLESWGRITALHAELTETLGGDPQSLEVEPRRPAE